ncbi:fibronectin type III domain-containing protein [bacterium]|nr:fibronectin type III domain-containing protein [bacterium]
MITKKTLKTLAFSVFGMFILFPLLTSAAVPLPYVATNPAEQISSDTAVIKGYVDIRYDPNGGIYWFEWGPSSLLGKTSSAEAFTSYHVELRLTGLAPQVKYYYRVIAHNSSGTSVGATRTFETTSQAAGPTAGTNGNGAAVFGSGAFFGNTSGSYSDSGSNETYIDAPLFEDTISSEAGGESENTSDLQLFCESLVARFYEEGGDNGAGAVEIVTPGEFADGVSGIFGNSDGSQESEIPAQNSGNSFFPSSVFGWLFYIFLIFVIWGLYRYIYLLRQMKEKSDFDEAGASIGEDKDEADLAYDVYDGDDEVVAPKPLAVAAVAPEVIYGNKDEAFEKPAEKKAMQGKNRNYHPFPGTDIPGFGESHLSKVAPEKLSEIDEIDHSRNGRLKSPHSIEPYPKFSPAYARIGGNGDSGRGSAPANLPV